jgi:hypothetical protein
MENKVFCLVHLIFSAKMLNCNTEFVSLPIPNVTRVPNCTSAGIFTGQGGQLGILIQQDGEGLGP